VVAVAVIRETQVQELAVLEAQAVVAQAIAFRASGRVATAQQTQAVVAGALIIVHQAP
jgi:hypothetical protein